MFVKVREEFHVLIPSTTRLWDEWPAVRDQVLQEAEKRIARTRSSDLASLLGIVSSEEHEFDEGSSSQLFYLNFTGGPRPPDSPLEPPLNIGGVSYSYRMIIINEQIFNSCSRLAANYN